MTEPLFIPRSDQVNYTNIRYAPVVNCVAFCKGRILLVQRSASMRLYPNYWSGVSGFLDDQKSITEKVLEEMREELGLLAENVIGIHRGETLTQEDEQYQKTWIVHPILVKVSTQQVKLDWEAQNHVWASIEEARKLPTLPGFNAVLDALAPYMKNESEKVYRHFKGGRYRVLHEALHTDDETELVIYESLQDGRRWARPKAEFFGNVETPKGLVSRFTLQTSFKNT